MRRGGAMKTCAAARWRGEANALLDAIRADIRQIRNWMFAGGIAIAATLLATLLNIVLG